MTEPNGNRSEGSEAVGLLTQLLASGADDFGALAGAADPPVHWPSVAAEESDSAWRELYGWVVALQRRFPEMVRLPGCWYRHNGLVEALVALRDHERASYAATAAPIAAAAWHVAFRDIEGRLRVWIGELRCGGDPRWHNEVAQMSTQTMAEPPDDFGVWIVEDRRRRETALPST